MSIIKLMDRVANIPGYLTHVVDNPLKTLEIQMRDLFVADYIGQ